MKMNWGLRIFIFLNFCIVALTSTAQATGNVLSAHREPYEDWRELSLRARSINAGTRSTPQDSAVDVDALNTSVLPVWTSQQLMAGFKAIRDTRFTEMSSMPGFSRRSSWLYPDDGCFARAALAGINLAQWKFPRPLKLFAIGNLSVKTPNNPNGSVDWWWHVVPIVSVAGKAVVLDPAIDPLKPLAIKDWLSTMSSDIHAIQVAICHETTYTVGDECHTENTGEAAAARQNQDTYLNYEWRRMQDLGRDPKQVLGDNPPWPLGAMYR